MRTGRYKAIFLLLPGLGLASCATAPFCDAPNKCGGDFLGGAATSKWSATTPDACIDEVPNPPSAPSLALVPPRPAGTRAIEPSTLDWCAGLINAADGLSFDDGWYETLRKFNGWFPSAPLYTADLELTQNNAYTITTVQLVSQRYDLSQPCLIAQGIQLTCDQLNDKIKASVEMKLGNLTPLTPPQGKVQVYANTCTPMSEGGCSCSYNVSLTTTTSGPWSAASGDINFFDPNGAPPSAADYCVSASGLSLSGAKGSDLFNRTSLKTLKLRPAQ